jgi:glycosyltransferase involved in cell wall biosynthesis
LIQKNLIYRHYFKILLLALIYIALLVIFYNVKYNTTVNFVSSASDDDLEVVFDKNTSQYVSKWNFTSSWNFSTRETELKYHQYKHCFCSSRELNQTHDNGKECSFILDRSVLIHHPPMLPHLQRTPCLLMDEWLLNISPVHSVILTVWNQERMISKTLSALLKYTHEWWELIVVFDQCHDKSILIVENMIKTFISRCSQSTACPNPSLVHIRLINQISGVSETTSNNIGMRASHVNTTYFILVQDDIVVRQDSWNCILAVPVRLWTDVFSVSGRCGHRLWNMHGGRSIGRCNTDIDSSLKMSLTERSTFYVCDTGNRGPLLLHAARTRLLGYLDEMNYWLGDDEHDLNFRAYALNRWVAGFQPIDFDAPLEFGGIRRKTSVSMTSEDVQYRELRIARRNLRLGALYKFQSHQWENTRVMIVLRPGLASIDFHTYMKDEKNFIDITKSHDEKRLISSDVMHCKN